MLAALQEEAGEPGVYAALLELLTIASLDELAVLAELPASDITPLRDESPAPLPRPVPRRRRR